MPLPPHFRDNWSFQKGDFSGLISAGPCFLLDRMQLPGGVGTVKAFAPGPFAVIDDVRAVDADGTRKHSVDAPGVPPADTSAFSVRIGTNVLWGVDGAWLELDGVQIDPGESLRFMWKFVSPPSLPALEDFALFLVQPDVGDRLVVVAAIYTDCTTICPITTVILQDLQGRLGDRLGAEVRLMSVTLDPARDTPARLAAAAREAGAREGWLWLTGRKRDLDRLTAAMGAYSADFTQHPPVFLVGDGARGLAPALRVSLGRRAARGARRTGTRTPGRRLVTRLFVLLVALALLAGGVARLEAAGFDAAVFFARGDAAVRARPGPDGPLLPSTAFACARCHGADGRGGREGGIAVPAIGWRALSLRTRYRPPYDVEALTVALTQGRDPAGNALHPVMPRFLLDREQVEALARFLDGLDRRSAPGVDARTIRLGLLLPPEGRHPAADRVRAVARAVVADWNRAGGFWGREVELSEPAADDRADDIFAFVLRMLPVPRGLEGVPDLFPLVRGDAPSALSLLPSEAEVDRLLEERAALLGDGGAGPVRIVRSAKELRDALAEGTTGLLLGELDRLAGEIPELPRRRAFVLELLDVHPFTDPGAEEARRFAVLAGSLGLDPERAGFARLAFASLLFLEDAFEAAGRHPDRDRFLTLIRGLSPRASGLLPTLRPGEPVPLDRLVIWRLEYPEGRVSRQPAAAVPPAASSTRR